MNRNYSDCSKIHQFSIDNKAEFIVKGITIHNTNNELSAKDLYNRLVNSRTNASCHFLVDEKEVIELVPLTMPAMHTGKGYDFGNMNTIAIEICRSQYSKSVYLKAQERACKLIAFLMHEFKLTENDIYYHSDFNNRVNCPHKIRELYSSKDEFIRKEIEPWL